jgi:hypothetical protein
MAAPFHVLSYGENHYKGNRCMDGRCKCRAEKSVHAEQHAVQKLPPPQKRGRHLKKVDLLVIRVNRSGTMGNSKPCVHCIYMLAQKLPEKGYSLARIYYSDEKGGIHESKLRTLMWEDEAPHLTKFYQDHPGRIARDIRKNMASLGKNSSYAV